MTREIQLRAVSSAVLRCVLLSIMESRVRVAATEDNNERGFAQQIGTLMDK